MRPVDERSRSRCETDPRRRRLDDRATRLGRERERVLVPASDGAIACLASAKAKMFQRSGSLRPVQAQKRQIAANSHNRPRLMGHLLRSEEHTSELQSLMRISYAVFCLKKK